MEAFKHPLEQAPALKPVKPDVRSMPAANDDVMFSRKIIDMEDGTQKLEDRTPEALMARAKHQRDNCLAMMGIYEAIKRMEEESTPHGKRYRLQRERVTMGEMDEIKLELPPEWESQLEVLIARALKIPLNVFSNYEAMKSEFKSALQKGTVEAGITRYAEEAVRAETAMAKYQRDFEERLVVSRYDDEKATTVLS